MGKYCHGTTDFLSQINENMILDSGVKEEMEILSKKMIDSRMTCFLKKYGFCSKAKYFAEFKNKGNFEEILSKYNIDLTSHFPGLQSFGIGHKASFVNKSKYDN